MDLDLDSGACLPTRTRPILTRDSRLDCRSISILTKKRPSSRIDKLLREGRRPFDPKLANRYLRAKIQNFACNKGNAVKLIEGSSSKNAMKRVGNFLMERKVRPLSKGHKSRLVSLVLFAKDRTVGNERTATFDFSFRREWSIYRNVQGRLARICRGNVAFHSKIVS